MAEGAAAMIGVEEEDGEAIASSTGATNTRAGFSFGYLRKSQRGKEPRLGKR